MANKKSTKTNKAQNKKEKLESLQYTDGLQKDVDKIKSLESMLGIKQSNPYGTTSIEVFDRDMAEMNMSDLQALAVRVGVFPSGTKATLKKKLQKQFSADNRSGLGTAMISQNQKKLDPNDPKQAETIRLMNEAF
jgi:hypothetical protein|tara:strand:- start:324 stop:728 length:405 start_codon:yes stop_codon:yes gene_type:complete